MSQNALENTISSKELQSINKRNDFRNLCVLYLIRDLQRYKSKQLLSISNKTTKEIFI